MSKTLSAYYNDDDETGYQVLVNSGWIGYPTHPWGPDGSAHTYPPLPIGMRMRAVTCVNAHGYHRNIPIQSPTTWEAITIGQVFSMPTNDGAFENWTVIGKIAQSYNPKRYRRHHRRL